MQPDIARLRPAEVVRRPEQTLVMRPIGEHLIRKRTKAAVLKELYRLQKRGYVHSASELAQFHARAGGGYGMKVNLLRPLPAPMPAWAKGCALVGASLSVLALAAAVALNALASLVGAASALPWALIIAGAVAVIVLLLVVKRVVFGGGISISQNVNIR